jgi:U4/U6.U5 tri-snRNP-associated protein 1
MAQTMHDNRQFSISQNLVQISLDYQQPIVVSSDYADPSTFKIKKPKKKKGKNSAKVGDILGGDSLLQSDPDRNLFRLPATKREYSEDSGFGDDDELQEMLAQQRRQALKKRKVSRLEDIVQHVRQINHEHEAGLEEGSLIIDDTSEFVRGIEIAQTSSENAGQGEEIIADELAMNVDATPNIEDVKMTDATIVETTDELPAEESEQVPSNGIEDEEAVGNSVAATLSALIRQDAFKSNESNFSMEDLHKREEVLRRQQERNVQQEHDARIQRDRERQSERFKRMTQREREQYREEENKKRERQEAYQRMNEFNDFKFNVELQYKDEFGQEMTPKDVSSANVRYC